MFDCGINQIVSDVVSSIEQENEKRIYKAVQSVGIHVDKKQLEKALCNAKSFYNDGYEDAKKRYESKWISVSEGLPREGCRIEVTLYSPTRKRRVVRNGDFYNNKFCLDNGDCWNSYDEEILAWKYECEPYGESEGK